MCIRDRNKSCPFVPAPINGTKNGTSNIEGSHLIFTCDPGFDLLGSEDIVCQADGNWSDNPPVCIRIYCVPVDEPVNGNIQGDLCTVGSVLQFSCNEGYQLHGSEEIICKESGEWSGEAPACEEADSASLALIIGVTLVCIAIFTICVVLVIKKKKKVKVHAESIQNDDFNL
ncbi:E-selectin-like [Anneissia japonica]|uniref:E-selectin-like n=1 Tax=Anneissia japonica TaxID=1529436 RepID=UPI0014255454|nr:E-selectin-like [Anneissia japonica]